MPGTPSGGPFPGIGRQPEASTYRAPRASANAMIPVVVASAISRISRMYSTVSCPRRQRRNRLISNALLPLVSWCLPGRPRMLWGMQAAYPDVDGNIDGRCKYLY